MSEEVPVADPAAPGEQRRRQDARRRFLRTVLLAGGVLGAQLSGYLPLAYAKQGRLRPPGALDEHEFLGTCIKCGQCVQVCPVQAIKLADLIDGFGVGLPMIEARSQACDFSCDAAQCILACPTGALTYDRAKDAAVRLGAQLATKPVLKAKQAEAESTLNFQDRMGVARLNRPESCLARQGKGFRGQARGSAFRGRLRYVSVDRWKPVRISEHPYDVAECDLCVRECPIAGAIGMEELVSADGTRRKQPVIRESCVGCGVCEMICPVDPSCITVEQRGVWKA